jgi:hypothetical protein
MKFIFFQNIHTYSAAKIARAIKSITAREIFADVLGVKLWSEAF